MLKWFLWLHAARERGAACFHLGVHNYFLMCEPICEQKNIAISRLLIVCSHVHIVHTLLVIFPSLHGLYPVKSIPSRQLSAQACTTSRCSASWS